MVAVVQHLDVGGSTGCEPLGVRPVADRVAFLENGRMGPVVSAGALRADRSVADRYLGV